MIERKEFDWAEVAKNDGSDGSRVWIVIWGNVYDVTDYLNSHPGGGELITEYAGRDATSGFDDFGHSSDAKKLLKKYFIGTVAKTENGKSKDKLVDFAEVNPLKKDNNVKQRRKFLRVFLGSCASA